MITSGAKYFLSIDGMNGGSTDPGHEGWFEIDGYDFDVANLVGTGSTGRAEFAPLTVDLGLGTGLTDLLARLGGGPIIRSMKLEAVSGGDAPQTFFSLKLGDATLSSLNDGEGGSDQLSFTYGKINLTNWPQRADGSLGAPQQFSYDIEAARPGATISDPVPQAGPSAGPEPVTYFLAIDGISGGSTDPQHLGWFEIDGYDLDVNWLQGQLGAGRPDFDPLTVSMHLGPAYTQLLSQITAGGRLASLKIEGMSGGATPQKVYELKLGDVSIGDMSGTAAGQFTFGYDKISVATWPQGANGSPGAPDTFSYDIAASRTGVDVADPVVPPSTGTVPEQIDYFLLIDGLNGGSADARHQGWYEIKGYDLDIARLVSQVGGGGVGKPEFDPLTVNLELGNGLTGLLSRLAQGQPIPGIKIEGVTTGTLNPRTVVSLKLGQVHISGLDVSGTSDDSLRFDYNQISLTTTPLNANGTPGTPQTFSYDIANAQTGITISDPVKASATTSPAAPERYFLAIDGVHGNSTDPAHPGWFEIEGYDLDVASIIASVGGGSASRPTFDPVKIDLGLNTGLTDLLTRTATGRVISSVRLEGVTGGETPQTVLSVSLGEVSIQAIDAGSDASDRVTLGYNQIDIATHAINRDGSLAPEQSFGYDVAAGRTLVTDIAAPQAVRTGGAMPEPARYFMLVDGMNGGSTDPQHLGWFEIDGYGLDLALLASQGGGGVGKPDFDPLTVGLGLGSGLTQILGRAATGQTIRSVKIEGVTGGSSPQTVLSLKLGDVTVQDFGDTAGAADRLSLSYDKISLSTWTRQPNGSLSSQPQTFAYDVTRNTATASIADPTVGAGTGGVPATDRYFMKIDGVRGDSTDPGHAGWFEIDNYDLGITTEGGGAGGGGASRSEFAPVTVSVNLGTGLAALLATVANGALIPNVRIDAVSGGETPRTVLSVRYANVGVSNVSDASDDRNDVTFRYGQIYVTSRPELANGQPAQPQVFGFDVTHNQAVPVCYCAGTRIATPTGEVAIERLRRGDSVLTAGGEERSVLWIGRQTMVGGLGDPHRAHPVRIAAGALADGIPRRDLFVSPDHAVLVEGVLVQAAALVNGRTVDRVDPPELFVYYHLELADHALVLAEGAPAETFVDNVQRARFDNYDEYLSLFGDSGGIRELELPRAKSVRQLPAALRARLADRSHCRLTRPLVAQARSTAPGDATSHGPA